MRHNGYMGKTKSHYDIDNHAPSHKGRFLLRRTRQPKSGKSKMLSFGIYKLNVEGLTYELVEYIELKIFLI